MALFSFKHSVKTFSDKRSAEARAAQHGQTAAHLRYITRPKAARVVFRERLAHPKDAQVAVAAEREAETRKGRVCERFILALPVEATPEQREALVRAFGEALTKGTAGYVAAIHDQHGNDAKNPHAHIAAFDVQVKGGGRGRPRSTIGMARKNAVEETAALWADIHNRMMAGWGYGAESQISHLSYAARGIDRLPQIHEGAASRHMFAKGETPATNADWHHIDGGHTRAESNALIREINTLKQEAEHDETDPTDGLGSGDEGDRSEREYCCGDGRKDGGSHEGDAGRSPPPWAAVVADGSNDEGDGDEGTSASTASPQFLAAPTSAPVPPFAFDHRRLSAWGRVRRVYRELVMLRDTLRARLLGDREAQRSAPPTTAQMGPSARDGGRLRERD
ncbi:MobA/MobL family protein [Pseudotabrizicola formosa]|uniref:MobA/MobL family protein n=1 Tax=Pseudotabrizicola formosa TaxID=2030009 RepID=UPI000CD22010|nr:MobA/MobL family protein [Pseudotabrizicola formosa]